MCHAGRLRGNGRIIVGRDGAVKGQYRPRRIATNLFRGGGVIAATDGNRVADGFETRLRFDDHIQLPRRRRIRPTAITVAGADIVRPRGQPCAVDAVAKEDMGLVLFILALSQRCGRRLAGRRSWAPLATPHHPPIRAACCGSFRSPTDPC